MNWTEGNLNRHSRARKGKETLLRQKEHFARVRAGLPDANVKISPPSLSVLADPERPPFVRRGTLRSTSSGNHQNGDQLMSSRYFSEAHAKLPAPTSLPKDDTEEVMRQKRRKLLLKGDWVGTNVQKPIEMEFTKPGGSPSNPWAARKSRHTASKHKLRKLVGLAHLGDNKADLKAVKISTPTSFRQIRVRVGPYERALGDSLKASSQGRDPQVGLSGSPGQPVNYHWRVHRQDRSRLSASLSISSHRSQITASQTPLLTTSPLLYHPVPTRPALPPLLHRHSEDSDDAGSTIAQAGAERPAASPSQAAENDMWRNFVRGPDEVSASNELEISNEVEDVVQRPIPSGLSHLDESVPEIDQAAPNSDDDSPSTCGVDLPQPCKSPTDSYDPNAMNRQNTTAGSSDEVSLLAISSSPKLWHSPDMVDEVATFEMTQPGDIGSLGKKIHTGCKRPDENDMWRSFVFGEYTESLEMAYQEARRVTARCLQPPLPSTGTDSCDKSQKGVIISSVDSDSVDRQDFAEALRDSTRDMFTVVSASHVAAAGTLSAEFSSETTSESMSTAIRTDRATHGSSCPSSTNGNDTARLLCPNDLAAPDFCEADAGPSPNNPEQFGKHGEAEDGFKFARPKLFIGKMLGQVDEKRQIALSAPQIRGTTQARRRQKRAADGRANIRKLPNYGSDPIEDFEGDARSDRAEKGSMFGPLETENNF